MFKRPPHIQQLAGTSLIEIMVGLAAGVVLMLVLLTTSSQVIQQNTNIVKREKLNNELTSTLNLLSDDIRRAGYWQGVQATQTSTANSNPFMSTSKNITINAASNCIIFSYDRDKNGSANTNGNANTNEHFGYRLSNNIIQALTNDIDTSCSSTSSDWQNLTDSTAINVTTLSFARDSRARFTLNVNGGTSTMLIRYITITISANLTTDSSISNTVTKTVRVRNDLYTP